MNVSKQFEFLKFVSHCFIISLSILLNIRTKDKIEVAIIENKYLKYINIKGIH